MAFSLPWRTTLGTWAVLGLGSGLLYATYEVWAERRPARTGSASPVLARLTPVVHGLALWPLMLPEVVEYWLADLGVLRPPSLPPDESQEGSAASDPRPDEPRTTTDPRHEAPGSAARSGV